MKTTTKPLTCITFKGTTKLPEDHGFKAAKYIAQYMMKGTAHVQIIIDEEGTNPNNSK
jgi:hypothetical protein